MSSSASTIDFLGLVALFESTNSSFVENTDVTELENFDLLGHDRIESLAERPCPSGHGTAVIANLKAGPLVVKEEFAKIPNNSGSTFGFNKKRFRERRTAVPTVTDMHQYLGCNDVAIEYFKAMGVIKNRVNEQCEILFERKKGRAGVNPTPRQCRGVLVERKFDKRNGEGNPVYSRYYRCNSCGNFVHLLEGCILRPARQHLHLFLFEMILVLQQTTNVAIERLTGLHNETVHRDRDIIMKAIIYDLYSEKDGFGPQIGGEGHHVQVDESKFGTTKYGKGRRINGVWVLGGVDTVTGEMFLVGLKNRKAKTLIKWLRRFIKGGSIVTVGL